MNYYEFLNKQLETQQGQQIGQSKIKQPTSGNEPIFNNDAPTVQLNGKPIFSKADKTEVNEINFDKLASEEAMTDENQKFSALEFVLKTFLSIDKIKNLADKDGDGKITAEEAKAYITELAGKDGNIEDISLEDFEAILKENNINLEELNNETYDVTPEDPHNSNANTGQIQETQGVANTQPTAVQSSGEASAVSSAPVSDNTAPQPKTIDNMSLSELQSEKTNRENTLKEKQSAVNAVNNGSNEKVKAAKTTADKAKAEYEKAIKEDDGAKKFAKQILNNNSKIEKNQAALDKNDTEITKKESDISNQENTLENLRSSLTALTDALSSLPAPTGKEEDKDKDAKIKAKKDELQKNIAAKKNEVSKQEKQLEKLKKELEKLKENKTKLETEKKSLMEEKSKLDEQVKKNCSEATKGKLEAFNKAQQNVDKVKTQELTKAKSELKTAQDKVKEVDKKITEAKNREIKSSAKAASNTTDLNIENIPASVRKQLGGKVSQLSDGTQVLTFNYTKLDQMQPEFVAKIPEFQRIADEMGYTFVISDGSRSVAESNAARARKGTFVAKGGNSPHNYGVAIDIALYKDGKAVSGNQFKEYANRVKTEAGITWGGDWGSYGQKYETQHFELADWKAKYKNPQNLIQHHLA